MRWRRLKRYCDGPPEYGLNVSSDAYVDEGYRLLRTTDIDDAGALSPESEGVCVGRHLVDPRHVLIPGDLLFSRAGSLGRCFRVPQEARDLTFAGYLVRFRPLPMVDPRYIQYCVAAGFVQASIIADAVTSTISNFNAERYGNLLLPEKDPKQQRAIADYLDRETARIDALIEKKGCLVERLGERRQSLITGAVTGELGVSEMAACRQDQSPRSGDPRAITGGDRVKTIPLKRIVGINLYTLPETTEPGFEFRYVDIGAVGRGQLVSEPEVTVFSAAPSRARRLVRSGDTIISTVRTYLRAVWPVRDSATDLVVSTGFAVLTPTGSIDSRYLGWLAQSDVVIEEVVARSVGVSYPAINPSDIGTIRVPLPPLPYQLAIADYLDRETARIDALIKMINQQTSLLAERRQALITAAATGELQIPGVAA